MDQYEIDYLENRFKSGDYTYQVKIVDRVNSEYRTLIREYTDLREAAQYYLEKQREMNLRLEPHPGGNWGEYWLSYSCDPIYNTDLVLISTFEGGRGRPYDRMNMEYDYLRSQFPGVPFDMDELDI
jgi:hypothetical protein